MYALFWILFSFFNIFYLTLNVLSQFIRSCDHYYEIKNLNSLIYKVCKYLLIIYSDKQILNISYFHDSVVNYYFISVKII